MTSPISKKAVSDTSTRIRLFKGRAFHCFGNLFEVIYIPEAVQAECKDPEISLAIQSPPFQIITVQHILPIGMGKGEREAISLAVQTENKYFITDDERAFNKAISLGLLPIRSYSLLLIAKEKGFIPSVKMVLDKMIAADERIGKKMYRQILAKAEEI